MAAVNFHIILSHSYVAVLIGAAYAAFFHSARERIFRMAHNDRAMERPFIGLSGIL
jgi:hypothetical protein